MLEAQERRLLLDALRPPEGYDLDCAVGTTFTLDLLALLTAPLGFTLFEFSGAPHGALNEGDTLVLLRAIRKYADRIALFCQAGRIAPPVRRHPLFATLESTVIEVNAPKPGAVFHPKVWVLRFAAPESPIRYRLLCLTRNLTFDRCWDTVLALDGELQERKNAIRANHPLGDFVEALPALAVRKDVSHRVRHIVGTIAEEVRRVAFEPPHPFDVVDFWPMGLKNSRRLPFDRIDRVLVMSPFLSANALEALTESGKNHVLISRLDSLQQLTKKQLAGFRRVFAMSPGAVFEAETDDIACDPKIPSTGLHAKLYVADQGWDASVWTGSANATSAGLRLNVEFLIQLCGPKSKCGVDAFLAQSKGITSLRDLLEPFEPSDVPVVPDPSQEQLEDRLEDARRALGHARWTSQVTTSGTPGVYTVNLFTNDPLKLPGDTSVRCWPITVDETASRPLLTNAEYPSCTFEALSLEALTGFVVFDVTVRIAGNAASCRFTTNTELLGQPVGRQEALLRNMLRDRRQVIRFLLLLLNDSDMELSESPPGQIAAEAAKSQGSVSRNSEALLEPLMRALEREPYRLDQIDALLRDLESSEDATALVPPGLRRIWDPIWEARQVLK
jgi:hypothetical protein